VAESIRWDWISDHLDDVQTLSFEHLQLVAISVAIATAISVPVAIVVRRRASLVGVANLIGSELYTIPSLALFAFLVPSLGIGSRPVIVGLVIYSVGILIRNTVVGLQSVPGPVQEAARGMGLSAFQILYKVELPLALPAIVTGIRIATVSAVGIATIGVLVDGGGLGEFIYNDGISRDFFLTPILLGAVLATVMAIVLDLLLLWASWALRPWARARAAPG
jgi:osmoprotectant transport system permease protein